MNQGRAFATARLPNAGLRSVCTITSIQKIPRLLVATQEGYLHIYSMDTVEGGECTLLRTHTLEKQALEQPQDEASGDRPLTQGAPNSDGSSYASTVRGQMQSSPASLEAAAAAPSGKPTRTPLLVPHTPWRGPDPWRVSKPRGSYAKSLQ